ncbi:hypothetical protein EIP86_007260 [Pleurotus ostreatoroseus]|nr:hypothetical protein EIP86_007260 [Pleurotus ostreatoroseus]
MSWIVRPSVVKCSSRTTKLLEQQLYHAKANTIWPESETIITKLINHAIGTGTAVAVCGLITLVLFVTSPEDSLQYLSGYSNSVLVTLNARRSIRRDIAQGSSAELGDIPRPNGVSLSFRVPPTTVRTGATEGRIGTDASSLSGIAREISQDAASVKRPEKSPAYYDVVSGDVALVELASRDARMRKGDREMALDDLSNMPNR